jgi:hypothetical protein
MDIPLTLNIVGDFNNPWKGNKAEEIDRIRSFLWAPAVDSWEQVVNTKVIIVQSFSQFLGVIQRQPKKKIYRINFWSHGNPGLIAFKGTIDKNTKDPSRLVMLDVPTALDLRILDPSVFENRGTKTANAAMMAYALSDRFVGNAHLYLYLCHSGTDGELIQSIADAFQVTTHGFTDSIWVCPDTPPKGFGGPIKRGFTSVTECRTKFPGFSHLQPTINRSPRPRTKYIQELLQELSP